MKGINLTDRIEINSFMDTFIQVCLSNFTFILHVLRWYFILYIGIFITQNY